MRVLLIEDHRVTRELIADHLRCRGYTVDAVQTGDEGWAAALATCYDALILDFGLPDVDGSDLLPKLRESAGNPPILVVTARSGTDQMIRALDGGADDIIPKPFDVRVLEARLRAVLRRPGSRRSVTLAFGDVAFDTASRSATVATQRLSLARRETMVLECLIGRGGNVVPRDVLDDHLYGIDDEVSGNALEAVISRLRRRLLDAGSRAQVEAVRGIGYRLRLAEA